MIRNRSNLKRGTLLLIIVLLCLTLNGCRPSPVLHDIEYTKDASQVDPDVEMEEPDEEGEETEDFNQEMNEISETPRDTERSTGIFGAKGSEEQSVKTTYSSGETNNMAASDAPTQQTADAGSEQTGGVPAEQPQEAEPANTPEPDDNPENTGGGRTYKQVVDGRGVTVEVPEDVGLVTATGAAAQMVEMLGGSGRLAGSDSALLSGLAASVFPDAAAIPAWWDGDGSTAISDGNFAQLLAALPDVCFEISGLNTFTDAQVQQLTQDGIAYVVLPALASAEDLKHAVDIVAQVMGGSAAEMAERYYSWVDGVVSEVSGAASDSDMSGLYIYGWDDAASYHLSNTKGAIPSDGSGLAVAFSPIRGQLISTFMAAAGVKNESTRIASRYRDTELVYVTPMFHQFDAVVSENAAKYYSGAGMYGSAFDLFVARMITDSTYYQLGSVTYPAVIVSSDEVKDRLENNWFWQYHDKDSNGYINIDGQSFYCAVIGGYSVYVNPYGMSSWESSLESPLEAYWVASKYKGIYTIDQVKEKTNQFYADFFGITLNADQLTYIFGE